MSGEHAGPSAYDELPDGVVVADETEQVVIVNAAAGALLGSAVDELVGKDLREVLPLRDATGRAWWPWVNPYGGLAIRTGHPERSLILPGGTEVLVAARYVRDRRLGPVRRVVVTLRGAAARERWDRDRSELVATVAHELRSPLTSVKGFTATLLSRWDRFTDAQRRQMLETVEADADRLARVIAELLDIARIDSGRLEVRRQVVEVAAVARRHVAGLVAAGGSPDRLQVEVVGPLPELWADPDKLDRILANLLDNALRHGGGVVRVRVEACAEAVVVTVSDEGAGVAPELVNRIFARFWKDGRRGGSGLGLYIAKGLVEAHGGTITVGPGPGGGAAFRFTLPVGEP